MHESSYCVFRSAFVMWHTKAVSLQCNVVQFASPTTLDTCPLMKVETLWTETSSLQEEKKHLKKTTLWCM